MNGFIKAFTTNCIGATINAPGTRIFIFRVGWYTSCIILESFFVGNRSVLCKNFVSINGWNKNGVDVINRARAEIL